VPHPDFPPKQVTLLLCDRAGAVLGTLPPFEVEVPWWQEVGGVVTGARERYGAEVTVLRLLDAATGWNTAGGPVTYLAEGDPSSASDLTPWSGPDPTVDHPLRLPFARPGGPAADLAWADEALAAAGRERSAPAEQIRTWNLSSIWRLPTAEGPAWLKVVPPFFAHEGAMLQRLDPRVVPPLMAAEGPRVLMADAPGEDHWGAELPVLERLVTMLVGLQADWVDRVGELEQVGAPDWRAAAFGPAAERVLAATAPHLDPAEVDRLRVLVDGLPARFAAVAACGVPDTFVHGDFHPGNARGSDESGGRSVLLDWGDLGIGNPLLDQAATLASIREEQRGPLHAHWSRLWRDAVPGSDPDRAAELLGPVRAVRQAIVYQVFLDNIEPAERVYHSGDPAHWLRKAAELVVSD
jgi:hypothetical protein